MRTGLLAACAILSASVMSAADKFEGRIEMTITDSHTPDKSLPIQYAIKGNKIRFDLPTDPKRNKNAGTAATLIDLDKHELIMLIDSGAQGKLAMRHPLKEQTQATGNSATQTPVATGKSDKIAGYSADEYKMTDEKGLVHDLWLGKGLGTFYSANQGGVGRRTNVSPAWEAFAREKGFFPLRVVSHDKNGKETTRMEVTKVDKTSLPDSLFSTEGYQEMQIPSFNGKSLMEGLAPR